MKAASFLSGGSGITENGLVEEAVYFVRRNIEVNVIAKLIFTAEVAEYAEKRKIIIIKSLRTQRSQR
jgi:hypothetical protein